MMKRSHVIILSIAVVIVIFALGITTQLQRDRNGFCSNLPDGSTYCADSVADFFYELSGGKMTFSPEDIQLDIAAHTYNAFADVNNTPQPYIPTSPPSGFSYELRLLANSIEQTLNAIWRSDPQPETPTPLPAGTVEHCASMPDGSHQCFASPAEMIYIVSEGKVTIIPEDLPMLEAMWTYSAYVIANSTPVTSLPSSPFNPVQSMEMTATAEHSN